MGGREVKRIMVVGGVAGVFVLFELVWMTHHHQLSARFHSPDNVFIVAASLFVAGWGLALVAPKVARWLALFTVAGAWAAASIAASHGEAPYALPLACVGAAAAVVAAVSFRGEGQIRRARTT